jgi:hypothetical protein
LRRQRRVVPFRQDWGSTRLTNFPCEAGRQLPTGVSTDGGVIAKAGHNTFYGSQVTDSEDHAWHSRRKGENMSDVGGNFFTQKKYVEGKPTRVSVSGDAQIVYPVHCQRSTYTGNVWAFNAQGSFGFPPSLESSEGQLNALGATAVARCKPTSAISNLSTSLAELLREGIPRVPFKSWEQGASAAQKAGDNYLNYEFGWKPLINDMKDIANRIKFAERIIRQYERDAGRVVRRRFTFPDRQELQFLPNNLAPSYPFFGAPNTRLMIKTAIAKDVTCLRSIEQKRWFSGAFTYYLPKDYSSRRAVESATAKLSMLFDLELTPETIWNLTPWSWAVDWFANVGDVISNLQDSANRGLVMRYGYLMEHTIVKDTYAPIQKRVFLSPVEIDSTISFVTETKKRIRANPFGFGVSWSGLSPYQLSIAAALGITKK